jgi:hypothetical protein
MADLITDCRDGDPHAAMQGIEAALRSVRISLGGRPEMEIHAALAAALESTGIQVRREFLFAPGCRADLWVKGIVIEAKRSRPPKQQIQAQIERYSQVAAVRGIFVVLEHSVPLPRESNHKPVRVMSLNALWGVSI